MAVITGAHALLQQTNPWPLAVALFFVGFVVTFFAAAYFLGPRSRRRKEESAAPKEAPPEVDLPMKVSRLTKAYEAGRLSREAYEQNLRALGVEPPAVKPKATEAEERARKVDRLRATYERGRISRQVYEENLRALGVEPEPEAKEEAAPEPPEEAAPTPEPPEEEATAAIEELEDALEKEPPKPAAATEEDQVRELEALVEQEHVVAKAAELGPEDFTPDEVPKDALDRIAAVKQAFGEGRIPREKYEEFLAKAYEGVDERFAQARMDLEAGVTTEEEYRDAVRALLKERE